MSANWRNIDYSKLSADEIIKLEQSRQEQLFSRRNFVKQIIDAMAKNYDDKETLVKTIRQEFEKAKKIPRIYFNMIKTEIYNSFKCFATTNGICIGKIKSPYVVNALVEKYINKLEQEYEQEYKQTLQKQQNKRINFEMASETQCLYMDSHLIIKRINLDTLQFVSLEETTNICLYDVHKMSKEYDREEETNRSFYEFENYCHVFEHTEYHLLPSGYIHIQTIDNYFIFETDNVDKAYDTIIPCLRNYFNYEG